MKNQLPLTKEDIFRMLAEVAQSLKEQRAEFEIQRKEEEQKSREEEQKRKEEEQKRMKEEEQKKLEENQKLSEERANQMKMLEIQRKIHLVQMTALKKELGGIGLSNGNFAEEYFSNSFFYDQKNFFGEKFDFMSENLSGRETKGGFTDEYDIVLFNCDSIAIIEVKYKARKENLEQVLRKPKTFRKLYPEFKHCKIYLGLASMTFSKDVEALCRKEGVAIIKQVGKNVVIVDKDLKVH